MPPLTRLFAYLIGMGTVGLMYCCATPADHQPPTLQLYSPSDSSMYNMAMPLSVQLYCSDDLSLYSYTLHLYSPDSTALHTLDTLISYNLNGQEAAISVQIPFSPLLSTAPYQLSAYCTDRFDRSSSSSLCQFTLQNATDNQAPILIDDQQLLPPPNDTISVFSGGNWVLSCGIADSAAGLQALKLYLQPVAIPFNYPNHAPLRYRLLNGVAYYDVVEVISSPMQEGYYYLHLVATDRANNTFVRQWIMKVL